MDIVRLKSGGPFEDQVGYCRAVVANGCVYVSGTVARGDDMPKDAPGQARQALEIIREALERAGTDMAHVVRVRYLLPDASEFPACFPVLAEAFGDNPPAATMLECGLIDPKYRIEIEVDAVLP